MAGFASPLFLLGIGNGSAPTSVEGVRSMLAPWIGGAASPATTGSASGYRGMLAFWAGGAANSGTSPPEEQEPQRITAGNLDDRRYRYRWAQGYLKRKRELYGDLEEQQREDVREEVQTLLEQREQAAEEASLALEQGQNIFLQMALDAIAKIERKLGDMGIVAPAFETQELDIVYVMFMLAASDD